MNPPSNEGNELPKSIPTPNDQLDHALEKVEPSNATNSDLHTPISNPLSTPTTQGERQFNSKRDIPWKKIAALGAVTAIISILCSVFILSLSLGPLLLLAIIFQGGNNIFIAISIIAAIISGRILKRMQIRYAYFVTSLSLGLVIGLYLLQDKLIPSDFSSLLSGGKLTATQKYFGNPITIGFLAIFISALLFVLLTYLTNRVKYARISILFFAILTCVLIIYPTKISKKDPYEPLYLKVKDLSWAVLPTYLPNGLIDNTQSSLGCADTNADVSNYRCRYDFKNYPGYLTQASQEKINLGMINNPTYKGYFAPEPFFDVVVYKDDPLIEPYKLHDGTCDTLSMDIIGTSYLEYREATAKKETNDHRKCSSITTTGGKTLYYEVPEGAHMETLLKVPWFYYFEQNGLIIRISIHSYNEVGIFQSLYFSDANFQPELFKFVEGFR